MSGFWSSETMALRMPQLISPYSSARVVNASYELGLGTEVFITDEDEKTTTKRRIAYHSQITIPPGQFANLMTEERVIIPNDTIGFISMKFSLKQRGLINVSGFHVDPGYSGKLLFSVYNAGPQRIVMSQGMPAFLLWICNLDQVTEDTYRQSGRTEISAQEVNNLQGEIVSPQALARRVAELERNFSIAKWAVSTIIAAIIISGIGWAVTRTTSGYPQNQPATVTSTSAPAQTHP